MPKRGRRPARLLRRWWRQLLVGGLAALAAGYFLLPWAMPWPQALNRPPAGGTKVTDMHGKPLRRLLAEGMRTDRPLTIKHIPQALVQATLAAEDHRFQTHGGIDPAATLRALRDGLSAGRRVSGASTITQQLVKLAAPRPRTLRTKVIETLSARRIEMTWPKDRILEQYFQRLDYGNLHLGPAAAAAGYFGKPLADCSLAECAFLAALPQSPTRLNPWRHAERAVARQQWILDRLAALGWQDAETLARAKTEPLKLRKHYGAFAAPHFVDLLLSTRPETENAGRTPATLTSSLDLEIQQAAERAISTQLARLSGKNVSQAAVVVMENDSGGVRALVGSRDYSAADGGQVNGATSRRSPGSALKPFTYLLALQQDLSPASILPDLPVEYITASGLYRPKNYNHRAAGPVPLRTALANSLNLSAVRVLRDHGGPEALIAALQSAGLTTLSRGPEEYGLGLTIGGGEVTLLELCAAYSCLARMGEYLPPRFAEKVPLPAAQRIFDPEACWLLADILADNGARSRSFGMDSALRLDFPCAVKTGTSTDYRDNWTIGYNSRFTVGVWVGNFDNSPMRGVSGVSGAAPIFREIFTWLESRRPGAWFPQPPGILERGVDPLTGLPRPAELEGKRPVVLEKFRRALAPAMSAGAEEAAQYDSGGRVILPEEYHAWLAGPDNWLGNAVVAGGAISSSSSSAASAASAAGGWRITSPLPGTTVLLDPDIPGGGRSLPLRAAPAARALEWSSPTLEIHAATALLSPGRHEITALDPATGRREQTWITVRRL